MTSCTRVAWRPIPDWLLNCFPSCSQPRLDVNLTQIPMPHSSDHGRKHSGLALELRVTTEFQCTHQRQGAQLSRPAFNSAESGGGRCPPSLSFLTTRAHAVTNRAEPNLIDEDVRALLRELLRELCRNSLSVGVLLSTLASVCDPYRLAIRAFCGVRAVHRG